MVVTNPLANPSSKTRFYKLPAARFSQKNLNSFNLKNKLGQDFMGPLQVWPMVCGFRGSKNVTYRQQTTDKKVNTEPL